MFGFILLKTASYGKELPSDNPKMEQELIRIMTQPLIFHVNFDTFFSIAKQATPDQRNNPLGISKNSRGIKANTGYEGWLMEVHFKRPVAEKGMIMPPEIVFEPGRHQKQFWLSQQIYNTLVSLTPRVEPYGAGAVFLDLSGNREAQTDPAGFARQIKHRIAADCKLTCSIGIGSNKLIAKIASDCRKPNGLMMIPREETVNWLHTLTIEYLPGIDGHTKKQLYQYNIWTIGELALVDEAVLVDWFGKQGALLYKMAWGREEGMDHREFSSLQSVAQR
jgi:DNA polymerase-4